MLFFTELWERYSFYSMMAILTLYMDEALHFLRIGTFLERADSTARLLDVKFHALRPDGNPHTDEPDYFAWSEMLACIGAVRTYRRIYRAALDPVKVAELMMLRRDVPRSVHHCLWMVDLSMRELADTYGSRGEADRLAGELHARLRYARIDQVFEVGLRKFLGGVRGEQTENFVRGAIRINSLGAPLLARGWRVTGHQDEAGGGADIG